MTVLLSLDPGLHIGAARKDADGSYHTVCFLEDYQHPYLYYRWLSTTIKKVDVVIVEQFQAQTISHDGLFTIELVGAICALAVHHGVKYIRHTPLDRKRLGMQDKAHQFLRSRVPKQKFVTHEEDALAHLFYYEAMGK